MALKKGDSGASPRLSGIFGAIPGVKRLWQKMAVLHE